MKTLLAALNAKHIHKAPAVWYLKAYCNQRGLKDIDIFEGDVNQPVLAIIDSIAAAEYSVVAFSCYIWNIELVCKVGQALKELQPSVKIILGGPEVSFEDEDLYSFADYIIKGEGEEAFYRLLMELRGAVGAVALDRPNNLPPFSSIPTPYTPEYFSSFSLPIQSQLIYYESTRGCPFKCAYCLSSACDNAIQTLPIERVKNDIQKFITHGAKTIKLVDRTFNADKKRANEILQFITELDTDCTFHFEVAADLFDAKMLALVKRMPLARVQFEIGIQTINEKSLMAVSRKTNTQKALANITALSKNQNCHIHVGLIAGLPFETYESFRESVNAVAAANPHQIQLGFLKLLKGTVLRKNAKDFGAVFTPFPPYEILKTNTMSNKDLRRLKQIDFVIDKYYNSGGFIESIDYAVKNLFKTHMDFFEAFAEFIKSDKGTPSLKTSYTRLFQFLLQTAKSEEEREGAAHCIKLDALSYDYNGASLPVEITQNRDKTAEEQYRKKHKPGYPIRIESFVCPKTKKAIKKIFLYNNKNPISNRYSFKKVDEIIL